MRTFFGIILGVLLTIGAAYLHDVNATGKMVNWEVVSARWNALTGEVQQMTSHVQEKFAEKTR